MLFYGRENRLVEAIMLQSAAAVVLRLRVFAGIHELNL